MRTVRTVAALRFARRTATGTVGLVPTMGALHAGHGELIGRARAECDHVVVSLFVNPAQFAPGEDLAAYPRDERRDAALAAAAGADVLFAPAAAELYPAGFATTVRVGGPAAPLEGEHRPGHFDGVATVVLKLLNLARPDVAYFGAKDAQQLAVVRRLVADLDLETRIAAVETVREPDGLARSSRNAYLEPADRARAVALKQGLDATAAALRAGASDPAAAGRRALAAHGVEPEYLALVHPDTFAPADPEHGDVLVAVAARVGPARLIDNVLVHRNGSS